MGRAGAFAVAAGLAVAGGSALAQEGGGGDRDGQVRPAGVNGVAQDERVAGEAGEADLVTIGPFSEPVELQVLAELTIELLGVNMAIDPSLTGTVSLPREIRVPREELLGLLDSLLNQHGFSIYYDERTRFYNIVPRDTLPLDTGGPLPTTRVIRTPNVRPSALSQAIEEQLGEARPRITYQDELGMLIATGSRRQIDLLGRLVEMILAERREQTLTRIELEYVSSPAARERLIGLLGGEVEGLPGDAGRQAAAVRARIARAAGQQDQGDAGVPVAAVGTGLENIADRLGVDPKGNALLFRGRADELAEVRALVRLIDVRDALSEKRYQTGTATMDIAEQARLRGLGEVVTMSGAQDQEGGAGARGAGQVRGGQPGALTEQPSASGGSRIVANPYEGYIMYYGTEQQQAIMDRLVTTFELGQDRIVAQTYKLYHADAEEVADILFAVVSEQGQTGTSPLLPGRTVRNQGDGGGRQPTQPDAGEGGESDLLGVGIQPGADIFVTPDPSNNQVVVRAPARLQDEVEDLIRKLDLRRPQVFIDIRIVSATMDDSVRVAFETQLINASGTGGGLQTNFGLTSAGDTFTDPRQVATGLAGLTSAVIKSDFVPIVVNALQTQVDGRIVSSPKLLVDDNEEATIESVDQEPITSINQGQNTDTVTFTGFEDAGTQVTVTPSISDDGYIRLDYEISLSNFTGDSTGQGIPPPRQDRSVTSESVTIPTDTTIVVGGIDVVSENRSVRKVPLLGDIPLIGHFFRDQSSSNDRTVLYVFITPKILRESNFGDLRLLTEGPLKQMKMEDDIPPMGPVSVPISTGMLNATPRGERSGDVEGRG